MIISGAIAFIAFILGFTVIALGLYFGFRLVKLI
ncbi:cytochrome b6-f complex subunit PetL [Gloeocapsa sp. PCC 73106]|nr:cytochrome b6-f complex subunit PetL [Gloeocapsa sp. PCC 73106]ELR99416.1 hypothetical protein GLO73106DRAFT_00032670 [Gloeocapsa sp. PCC 73106]